MADIEDASSVRVAVRIRPQLPRERIDNCRVCTSVTPGEPQVVLGNDKAFTFDQVFDVEAKQDVVFQQYAQGLIDGCFDGYNATILAYGQTGSGKTYSMGTGFDLHTSDDQQGIIPRAVNHLFNGVHRLKESARDNCLPEPTFQIVAQFMELYNEDIYDLFDPTSVNAEGKKSKSNIKIHEDANGSIYTQGVASKQVNSYQETMECLRTGALSRTTASTNMNSQSSRSHAIFTLLVKQTRSTQQPCKDESKDVDTAAEDFETLSAKFNFVDLAGSERLKRTGATGDRAKEGISINCGLLALGNVISALGDSNKKGSHVPYRDSKLTRLLQDSLGGNSRTVMIACISPSDRDFMETLNTLKYANRARNIKNKVVVNQDKTSKQLTELRAQIQTLQVELAEYKQGKRIVGPDGVESINDMFHENSLLQVENDKLRSRVKALQETIDSLTSRNVSLANERAAVILSGISGENVNEEVEKLVAGYTSEMETLRTKLLESEAHRHLLGKQASKSPSRAAGGYSSSLMTSPSTPVSMSMDSTVSIIELAKRDVEKSRKTLMSRQNSNVLSEDERNDEKEDSGGGSGGDESGEQDNNAGSDEDEGEEEMGDGSSTESSDESDRESDHLQEDLAELSGEISLKQRMIEELEKSQRQLQNIRQLYEDKLRNLQNQIDAVERERDQVLGTLGSKKQQSEEQVRKVRSEYEKRLTNMQTELNKVNAAKKEHSKMMKNQAVYDRRIKELSGELNDMKKIKVRLMAQMKTESEKNKRNDQKKSKELIQLKKEKRMRDNQLRMLELQNRQKDAILKRKHEEVSQLRKKQRDGSASSKVLAKNRVNLSQHGKVKVATSQTSSSSKSKQTAPVFSPKVAKSKWDKLEHYITSVVVRKQTISSMEAEMDLHIAKREQLSKRIDSFSKRLDIALHRNDTELAIDLEDQLETMTVNMNYIQDNVTECQNNIMQMEEEAKDETALSTALNVSTVEESKYLLDHLLSLALSQGYDRTQKESQYRELSARYEKMQMDSRLRDQLLEQVLQDSGITLQTQYESSEQNEDEVASGDNSSSCRSSPVNGDLTGMNDGQLWAELTNKQGKPRKARRKTSTPSELLLGSPDVDDVAGALSGKPSINIADIIPPAPKGPPPGRGHPPPIDTILEEEETDHGAEANGYVLGGSYTLLNSAEEPVVGEEGKRVPNGVDRMGGSEAQSSSGTSSPDMDSSKLLSGSYTILNGELRLSKLAPGEQGDSGHVTGKKVPPPVPPKPNKTCGSAGPIAGSIGMSKWKGVVSSHLDDVVSSSSLTSTSDYKPPAGATQAAGDQRNELPGRETHARVIGRRKLAPGTSPSLRRKTFQPSTSKEKLVPLSTEGRDVRLTPPSSPSLNKRRPFSADSDSSNVFMRLTNAASTSTKTKKSQGAGSVNSCEKVTSSNCSMTCVKKAVGHTKAVLSICVGDQLLISGSKDLTCKVWNLSIGSEVMSLNDHPNYVTKVRYCPVNRLIYTVANSFVKIWDVRSGPKCIKVLSSSGLVHESIPVEATSSSAAIIQQGEQPIFDIQLSADGQKLYTTTGTTVRLWDLNMYSAVGKVASGHQAPIICLSLYGDSRRQGLITGSKDHLIKLFDLSNELSNCLTQPKFTLDPPHYDGVQCFAHRGNTLFSGSRDMCIKKWDLGESSRQPQLVNGAHKGWIMDMGMLPDNDILVSCCRSGTVKLWSTDTCSQLDEVKAHSSAVNCMATNNSNLFTASSDGTVKIWWVDPNKLSSS